MATGLLSLQVSVPDSVTNDQHDAWIIVIFCGLPITEQHRLFGPHRIILCLCVNNLPRVVINDVERLGVVPVT